MRIRIRGSLRPSRRGSHKRCAALIGTVLLAATGVSGEEEKAAPSWYAMSVIQATGRMTVSHYWSKGDLFRSLTVIHGVPIVTLVNADTYYTIDVAGSLALAVERSPLAIREDASRDRPFANELDEVIREGGEKIRAQSVAGAATNVWRVTDEDGRRTVWALAEGPPVPIRVENFDRRTGITGHLAYVNWLYDIPLPDSFFEPWEGLKVRRITYEQYVKARSMGPVGPSPPLFSNLLNGRKAD